MSLLINKIDFLIYIFILSKFIKSIENMNYSIWPIKNKFDITYTIKTDLKFLIWDLIKINNDFFLIKDTKAKWNNIEGKISYIWNLFQPRTIYFQEFFSKYWYSYFFKIFNLFIQEEIYIERFKLPKIKKAKKFNIDTTYISEYSNIENYWKYLKMWDDSIEIVNYDFFKNFKPLNWQNLFVFPDLWSISCFVENIKFEYNLLDVSWTNLSRIKHFFQIKFWKEKNIITTSAWIFQDWYDLKSIFVFDPYKWYYKNQQNPRYYIPDVAKQIKFFYWVKNLYYVIV